MNPCIQPTANDVHVWLDVTALEPLDQLAMDVWLYDSTLHQGLRETAHHCQATLTAGQTYRCEIRLVPPTAGHRYEAASGAKRGTASTIPPAGFVGTLSGDVLWPAS